MNASGNRKKGLSSNKRLAIGSMPQSGDLMIRWRTWYRILVLASLLPIAACAGPNSHRTSALSQIAVGEGMLSNADYERAYELLDKVAENNPRSSMVALGLADAYFRQDALLKAAAYYQKAVDLGSRAEGKLGLARVELARNNPDRAQPLLSEVLRVQPGNLSALNAMGVAFDLNGQHAKAQEYYKTVLAREAGNKEALNNYALSLTLSGKPKDAYPYIAELSRSHQNDSVVRHNLALVQHLSGERERAMRTALVDLSESEAQANFAQISELGVGY